MRAVAAREPGVRRSRQRRHGARAEAPATSTSPPTTSTPCSRFAARERIALTIVGPGGAAGGRHRRPLRAPPGCACFGPTRAAARASRDRRPSPRISCAPPDPHRELRDLHARPTSTQATSGRSACRWWSRPTGSRPARAWSSARRTRRPSRAARGMLARQLRRRRRARSSSRSSCRARRSASSSWRTTSRCVPLATSQDHKRRDDGDQGPEHRRHGRLLAGAARHPGAARAHHARGDRTDARAACAPTASLSPDSCTPD